MRVIDVPSMSTDPGGPWLSFLSNLANLDVPFEEDEIPSKARREVVSQAAVKRVAVHLQAAGLPAKPWIKRFVPRGGQFPRLLCRVYWSHEVGETHKRNRTGRKYLFTYHDGTLGQGGSLRVDEMRLLTQGWDAYNREIENQTAQARNALLQQRPQIRRPKKWKFQHLSSTNTLVQAGGSFYLVQASAE